MARRGRSLERRLGRMGNSGIRVFREKVLGTRRWKCHNEQGALRSRPMMGYLCVDEERTAFVQNEEGGERGPGDVASARRGRRQRGRRQREGSQRCGWHGESSARESLDTVLLH